jgi:hypothetical protein
MELDWQNFAALSIVAAAALYLARQVRRVWAGSGASGCTTGCAKCPQSSEQSSTNIVSLEPVVRNTRRTEERLH